MSLDFFLKDEKIELVCICERCGLHHKSECAKYLFHINITHNLGRMADLCGVYKCLWRPDENGFIYAHQIIQHLKSALDSLVAEPKKYKNFEPSNGWGTYDILKNDIVSIIQACEEYPQAQIEVDR